MAGVKFIEKCHIQWIERSSRHRHCFHFFLVYSDQPMQKVIKKYNHLWLHKLGFLLSPKIPHHRCAILSVLILFKTTRPRAYIAFSLEALVGHQREEHVCQISKLLTVQCKSLSTLINPADNRHPHRHQVNLYYKLRQRSFKNQS